jgi:hypothetical protein
MTRNTLKLCLATFLGISFLCCEDEQLEGSRDGSTKDGSMDGGPPLNGQCGLRGQKVWCNEDEDCRDPYIGNECTWTGSCEEGADYSLYCDYAGMECREPFSGLVCDGTECIKPCQTHADCPGGYCRCNNQFLGCYYRRCSQDTCPEGYEEHPGSLICVPLPETLQGDCHGWNGICPAGYEPVGTRGCASVVGD